MTTAEKITEQLKILGNKTAAVHAQRFFKTGPGQYGEGDIFLGISVPVLRKLAKEHQHITLADAVELLQSPLHEIRLLALLVMLLQYKRGTDQTAIYRAYLANTHWINNWDLVDVTAEHIIGAHLFESNRQPLYKLARSKSLWERRIAIIATFYFIRRNQFDGDFRRFETIARMVALDMESHSTLSEPALKAHMSAVVAANPDIYGICIAFEPGAYNPKYRLFAPYV
jgi:3-methyladenine DNA glycosylase AlkD